jgi:hypothetical protein
MQTVSYMNTRTNNGIGCGAGLILISLQTLIQEDGIQVTCLCLTASAAALLNASYSEISPRPILAVVASSEAHLRMSGCKASGKHRRTRAAEDALLQLQALYHTHREATRLFFMAARG